ncbi:hypothetical protein [Algiphilus sp.]|uniref:hypothetical protein n=1 Tax=Algiphilus sp. TaxID=1872431 RepID=UPI003BAAFA30
MAKQLVFIVHGIGGADPGWSKPAVDALKKHYKSFKLAGNFGDRYEIKEIHYSAPLKKYWKEHDEVAASLKKLQVNSQAFHDAIVSLATSVPQDAMRSHIGDLFLYLSTAYNEMIALDVNIAVEKELIKRLFPTYSIIAHSLGTRVVFDTLQRSFSNKAKYTLRAKPRVLMMASDVTRLCSFNSNELKTRHGLRVFPSNSAAKGACQHFINACHPLDPIAVVRRYAPEFALDANYHAPNIEPDDITQKDLHSLEHYCRHPAVAAAFFNQTIAPDEFGSDPVSKSALTAALAKYREDTLGGNLATLKKEIEELEPSKFKSWKETVEKIAEIYERIEKFRVSA